MKIRALFSAALLLSAVSLTKAYEPGLQELQAQATQAEMYMNAISAVAALAELNGLLADLETPADVQAALPTIGSVVEEYHQNVQALPEDCNPPDTPESPSLQATHSTQPGQLQH